METAKGIGIAVVLSILIWVAWTTLMPQPKPAPPAVAKPVTVGATPTAAAPPAPVGVSATAAAPVAPVAAAAPVEPIGEATERFVTVETPVFTVRLSNRGGAVTSLRLKAHRDSKKEPLDLVRAGAPFPGETLALLAADPFLERAAKAFHVAVQEETKSGPRVTFRYREADGATLTRTYDFAQGYVLAHRIEREGPGPRPIVVALGPGIGNPSAEELANQYTKPGSTVALGADGSVTRHAKDGLKEPIPLSATLSAAGIEDNYFLTAFLPKGPAQASLHPVALTTPGAAGAAATVLAESAVHLEGSGLLETELYLGPKDVKTLQAVRPGMEKLIDFGMFAIIVRGLLWCLQGIYGWVGNWGVAIVIITFFIKVVLYPLTHQQLVSMKKMSALQPKMETIRAKWTPKLKTDPQARVKMNEEVMALYKKEGVNPAGGCLPLLLQAPFLWAFYSLLTHTIELRHAPFMLWIQDLSAKDPYYVTPIVMTATMWLQQQMTPATGDPAMRRVMMMMPLVFGFMFKDLPSGLVLYWLVQNVLTIAQQMILNRFTDLGPASAKKPA